MATSLGALSGLRLFALDMDTLRDLIAAEDELVEAKAEGWRYKERQTVLRLEGVASA